MCGGGGAPKPAAPPPPPPPPAPAPKRVDESVRKARSDERKRARNLQGDKSTNVTGGLLTGAETQKKQLLGQ